MGSLFTKYQCKQCKHCKQCKYERDYVYPLIRRYREHMEKEKKAKLEEKAKLEQSLPKIPLHSLECV